MTANRPRTALVSGSSVAGPVVAFWLRRAGWDVTVVEIAPGVRHGGYPVDVRGVAAEVVQRMGVYERLAERRFPRPRSQVIGPDGRAIVEIAVGDLIANVNPVDVEIARGDLTRILHEVVLRSPEHGNGVAFRFGAQIAELEQNDDGVTVEFSDGGGGVYDVVIGADGIHSRVRALAFGPEQDFLHHLGACVSIYDGGDDVVAPGTSYLFSDVGRTLIAGALPGATARVFASFTHEDPASIDGFDREAVAEALESTFRGVRWDKAGPLVAAARTSDDVYFDSVSQVRMPSWASGRVAVVGDAAYAPSFLSGQGTSSAILGGYVLASELAANEDVTAALRSYEARLRTYIDRNQALALRRSSPILQTTPEGLRRRNRVLRAVPWLKRTGLLRLLGRQVRGASNDYDLSDYGLR